METTSDNRTPREILSQFYTENNFDADGGSKSTSVKIQLTPKFHFYYPNYPARRKAVLRHDVHHLLTQYSTALAGETEISAWEIASGCKKYWAAFLLDTSGVMLGFPFNFFRILKAFARGRRTKNLYDEAFSIDKALDTPVAELRKQLLLDKHPQNTKPTFVDFILLMCFAVFGFIYSLALLIFLPLIIVYSVYEELKARKRK